MELLLKLLIIYIFFMIFIIGILLSKVKFNIKYFEYNTNLKEKYKKYEVNIGIFLFGSLKIIGATLGNDGIKILGKKLHYDNIKWMEPFRNVDYSLLGKDFKIGEIRNWKLELEKLDLKLDLGFENVLLTSFSIFLASTFLSFLVKKTVKKYDMKKHKYMINPHYRSGNVIDIKIKAIFSAKTTDVLNILFKYKNTRERKYKSLYRKSYENV